LCISTGEKRAYLRDLVNWPLAFLGFMRVTGFYNAAGQAGTAPSGGQGNGEEEIKREEEG